jgi:formylglycine-generating enzyme required for sulfatase activity
MYRVAGASNSAITGFAEGFVLQSVHDDAVGLCIIERSPGLDPADWTPFVAGPVSNRMSASRVEHASTPPGMAYVPGGVFVMGDVADGRSLSLPLHTVHLSPYFLQEKEITNGEMRDVLQWAFDRGLVEVASAPLHGPFGGRVVRSTVGGTNDLYGLDEYAEELDFTNGVFVVKAGKGSHPNIYVSWYGAAAYCHFRSLIEGLESCFDPADWSCDFSKGGYRLPTEAEWECAARGGYAGMRFPWGDTNVITHSRANYRSSTNNVYDVSPTRGFHPDYASQPLRTSPVGVFGPNAFRLHDMCGNVWEWCWDWAGPYTADAQADPRGPASGSYKVFRGGSNYTTAERTTVSARYLSTAPGEFGYDVGFRCAMTCPP